MPFEVVDTEYQELWLSAKDAIYSRYDNLKCTKSFGESMLIAKTEWLTQQLSGAKDK
jgi:hypothetical protein